MTSPVELEPCPFCQRETLLTVEEAPNAFGDIDYCVRCDECGAEGPVDNVREKERARADADGKEAGR